MKQPPPPTFQAAARRAVRRLLLARCLRLLGATAAPVFLTATALLVAWRLGGGRSSGPLCAGGVVLAWLLATALWAWLQRPTPAGATAAWDARAGRHEAFLSALCFEARPGLDDGERLHLAAQQRKLADGLAGLHRLIPLAVSWMLLLPVGFLGFSVSGLLVRPLPAEDRALDAEARRRAADEAGDLDRQSKKLDRLEQLDEKEQEAVEQLKASLDEAAEKLKGLDKETQRDVLTDLERRARQAEKLADSLGAGQACFRSSPMIAELARHAETADLANALRASDLEQTAHEATTIADGLRSPECTIEKHQRLQHALSKALGAADENDRRTLVARRLEPARKHLEADDRPRAAEEFDRIAEHFMRASQRVEAQRRLRRLAGKLRNAGQRIFGRRLRTMERLPQRLARNADMLPWLLAPRPAAAVPPAAVDGPAAKGHEDRPRHAPVAPRRLPRPRPGRRRLPRRRPDARARLRQLPGQRRRDHGRPPRGRRLRTLWQDADPALRRHLHQGRWPHPRAGRRLRGALRPGPRPPRGDGSLGQRHRHTVHPRRGGGPRRGASAPDTPRTGAPLLHRAQETARG